VDILGMGVKALPLIRFHIARPFAAAMPVGRKLGMTEHGVYPSVCVVRRAGPAAPLLQ